MLVTLNGFGFIYLFLYSLDLYFCSYLFYTANSRNSFLNFLNINFLGKGIITPPLDKRRQLKVHMAFRSRPGRLLNILCALKFCVQGV